MEDRSDRRYRSRDPLDQRIDQWVETGRQFVDGVSGRRPGQRRGPMALDSVGRWVGEKVEWLLEDDDDWREPWQDAQPASPQVPSRGKRPLDAISRRGQRPQTVLSPPAVQPTPVDGGVDESWPEDDSFRVQRWQRSRSEPEEASRPSSGRRPLPRSSRRRD